MEKAVKAALRTLMTNNLMAQFNQAGGGPLRKRGLQKTKIYIPILAALKFEDTEIDEDIGDFLKKHKPTN